MKRSKNTEKAAARSAKAARFRRSRCYSILFDKGVLYFLISFAAPMLIMLIAFADANIHPLGWDSDGGDRQILVVDLWHQYYPFFRVVREKLLTGRFVPIFMGEWSGHEFPLAHLLLCGESAQLALGVFQRGPCEGGNDVYSRGKDRLCRSFFQLFPEIHLQTQGLLDMRLFNNVCTLQLCSGILLERNVVRYGSRSFRL